MSNLSTEIDVPVHARRRRRRASSRAARTWLKRGLLALTLGTLGAGTAGLLGLGWIAEDLPQIRSIADYRPPQATVVYGAGGQVVARFARERRTVVPYARIPKVMIDAVLAAEDSDFFKHQGLDYLGIARCAAKNLLAGRAVCGASTITQQTVKTFFLSPEKTATRKLREMILAKRLEEALEKEEILFLYLNQIYFGSGAYGIQEASRVYFGKDVERLRLEEAALLAGLPQSPARLDPYRHPDRALARRAYVLERMRATQAIDEATYQATKRAPLALDWSGAEADIDSNNHFAAHVRTLLEADPRIGKELLETGGLEVHTGVDPAFQRAAESALKRGLRELDKRQGYRGALGHLDPNVAKEALARLRERRRELDPDAGATATSTSVGPLIFDLALLREHRGPHALDRVMEAARFPRLALDKVHGGVVTALDEGRREAMVDLGGARVALDAKTGFGWARKFDVTRKTRAPTSPGQALAVGDVVLVRATALRAGDASPSPLYAGVLEQDVLVEGAVVVIDAMSREVRALVGGSGVGAGTFNRAVQARRQAGSTFKPIVYAAAFEGRRHTPISKCFDEPYIYRDPQTGREWRPENYDRKFDGEMTLRTALTRSKNICSVRLIEEVGVDRVIDLAERVGLPAGSLPKSLTIALGAGDVTPLQMVNAYATFASGGLVAEPLFVQKVLAPGGQQLFPAPGQPWPPEQRRAVSPEVAYLVTSLMQSVVEDGTAQAVKELARPVAGKTGTSNEARNAWFIGYTPELVAGVWVGFDNNDPLGPGETGGRAAIPVWKELMKAGLAKVEPRDFTAPGGIVFVSVDPASGLLAAQDREGVRTEPFIAGTEPQDLLIEGAAPVDQGGLEDYR